MSDTPLRVEFVGLVVRAYGETYAIDLDGEDLELKVDIEVPVKPRDVTEFGALDWVDHDLPTRIDVRVVGHRRSGAKKLLTRRRIHDGDLPFDPVPA